MKQAIEEGFILNVLSNYTRYKSYYELTKSIEENPMFNNEKAQKLLRKTVERDPRTIEAKADIMLTHFDAKIFRNHKLKGQAKAMVVTKDIECAIFYYKALQKLIEVRKLPYKILIAFSGEKQIRERYVDNNEAVHENEMLQARILMTVIFIHIVIPRLGLMDFQIQKPLNILSQTIIVFW